MNKKGKGKKGRKVNQHNCKGYKVQKGSEGRVDGKKGNA